MVAPERAIMLRDCDSGFSEQHFPCIQPGTLTGVRALEKFCLPGRVQDSTAGSKEMTVKLSDDGRAVVRMK